MDESQVVYTDPARELAELCERLQEQSALKGDAFLSSKFEVEAWSKEFYQILFTIVERCGLLQEIVSTLELDEDYRAELMAHIDDIMAAFSAHSMRAQWVGHGWVKVGKINTGPLKALASTVRRKISYRKLSAEEVEGIDLEIQTLLEWLAGHQISEQDFIRQALIDGLKHFQFRLRRLQWLGWGYTLDSLRDVIAAYMLLERGGIDPNINPDAGAVAMKVGSFIKSVHAKVSTAKDVADNTDWLIKAYIAGSLALQGGQAAISGAITGG